MPFSEILKHTGPFGAIVNKTINKQENLSDDKMDPTTTIISFIMQLVFIIFALFLHYKCNNNSFDVGAVFAFCCPLCYLLVYVFTSGSCPSNLKKYAQLYGKR